jgi:hypothetical protein
VECLHVEVVEVIDQRAVQAQPFGLAQELHDRCAVQRVAELHDPVGQPCQPGAIQLVDVVPHVAAQYRLEYRQRRWFGDRRDGNGLARAGRQTRHTTGDGRDGGRRGLVLHETAALGHEPTQLAHVQRVSTGDLEEPSKLGTRQGHPEVLPEHRANAGCIEAGEVDVAHLDGLGEAMDLDRQRAVAVGDHDGQRRVATAAEAEHQRGRGGLIEPLEIVDHQQNWFAGGDELDERIHRERHLAALHRALDARAGGHEQRLPMMIGQARQVAADVRHQHRQPGPGVRLLVLGQRDREYPPRPHRSGQRGHERRLARTRLADDPCKREVTHCRLQRLGEGSKLARATEQRRGLVRFPRTRTDIDHARNRTSAVRAAGTAASDSPAASGAQGLSPSAAGRAVGRFARQRDRRNDSCNGVETPMEKVCQPLLHARGRPFHSIISVGQGGRHLHFPRRSRRCAWHIWSGRVAGQVG